MKLEYIVVLITVPSREVGEEVSRALLDRRLAACVNIVSCIDSLYWWQGKIQSDREVLLVVKSKAELFESGIIPTVRSVHPYDVPEIIAIPVLMGSREYLAWIDKETASEK